MATHRPDGQKVELVSADEWIDMSINDLFEQKAILNNRLVTVAQYGNPAMLKQMQIGLLQLDNIIRYKENQHKKNINNRNRDITGLI